jgi:hypothetical protein
VALLRSGTRWRRWAGDGCDGARDLDQREAPPAGDESSPVGQERPAARKNDVADGNRGKARGVELPAGKLDLGRNRDADAPPRGRTGRIDAGGKQRDAEGAEADLRHAAAARPPKSKLADQGTFHPLSDLPQQDGRTEPAAQSAQRRVEDHVEEERPRHALGPSGAQAVGEAPRKRQRDGTRAGREPQVQRILHF